VIGATPARITAAVLAVEPPIPLFLEIA